MSGILQDSSPAKLVTAIEENFFAWIPIFGKLGRAYANEPAGVKRSITDIPEALFNSVMDARLVPEQVDATIQFIVSDARARHVPVLWWIGPSTRPADLGKHLENHGFAGGGGFRGMAVDLMNLNEGLSASASFSIQLAQDEASWRQWSITMALGFGASSPNEHDVTAWYTILRESDPKTMLAYLGRLNDTPVATSLLFLAAGVAGIYCVATIPEARRQGIGAMMTVDPLRQAHSIGYKTGVLGASEMGRSVYRSLGFQEYCNLDVYGWKPETVQAG